MNRLTLEQACDELATRENHFAELLERFGYPPLWARAGGFATMVMIILEQQVSLASARAVYDRLLKHAGRISAERIARMTAAELAACGLTRQKSAYCKALAQRVVTKEISFARIGRSDEPSARQQLLDIKGVGAWSADVYLLFASGRADIWPIGDVALIRSVFEVFNLDSLPDDSECLERAENWRPWRSAAARMLWHAYLSRRGRQHVTAE